MVPRENLYGSVLRPAKQNNVCIEGIPVLPFPGETYFFMFFFFSKQKK